MTDPTPLALEPETHPEPVLAPAARLLGCTGVPVHPLALDGSVFGWAAGIDDTTELLDAFTRLGGTLISTADHYATGRSEYMIGRWFEASGRREEMLLATKVGRHPDAFGLAPEDVRVAIEGSLERLGTRIDLLSFDSEDPEIPIAESLAAAAPFVADGSVRALGAAHFSAAALVEAQEAALSLGLPGFSAVVAEYNLMERKDYEAEVAPEVVRQGLGTLARLPLASGYLTGSMRHRSDEPASVLFEAGLDYVGRHGNRVLAALDEIAQAHGTEPGVVALAWVLSHQEVSAAIVRARDAAELETLFAAGALPLTRSEIAQLDRASA
ncbi:MULTISPECIES: aldo/keto reductase [unclassified Rathayibacter]|uniref:aldo/keto reductase n=1 Tax=unclassified Rathayibacter TaxID=2609250 RepID=UPI00188AE533|nr:MULTISPECIES: aldo/keto reductase [unclassified Rathayibacter]MBF4463555.1 aldo/keto reductase [Rathayibacter sp. VKM Ac-2879]MBF4504995.1 aldo/keto reductase [Rathayibacter sp. VKM Ac-2878]